MELFQQRLQCVIDKFANGNNSKFASIIGSDEAKIRNYLKGTQPKIDFIQSVMSNFEINYEWFILGNGVMEDINGNSDKKESDISLILENKLISLENEVKNVNVSLARMSKMNQLMMRRLDEMIIASQLSSQYGDSVQNKVTSDKKDNIVGVDQTSRQRSHKNLKGK